METNAIPSRSKPVDINYPVFNKKQFSDDYFHSNPNIFYTECSLPGPGMDVEYFESRFVSGCDCKDGNCDSTDLCLCLKKYGKNYSDDGCLLESKLNGPILECNSWCACSGSGCRNRIVQYGPLKHLTVFESEGKGLGLMSERDIDKGKFVCEYAGEAIGVDEAKRRFKIIDESNGMNYIFILIEHVAEGNIKTIVDPEKIGNIGRYINHSCEPNTAVLPVRVDGPVPKLAIFSLESIKSGQELTFDYGTQECANYDDIKFIPCLCKKKTCRKKLPSVNVL